MVRRRLSYDSGVTGVEYAILIGLIAVVALVGIAFVGRSVSGSFEDSTLAVGAAMGNTSTSTATSTATATPTATATATRSAQSIGYVPQGETIVVPTAVWTRVGNSANYRWECANDYNLGSRQDVRSTSRPPGPAPDCG